MKNKEGEIINGIIYGARNTVTEKWYIGQTTVGLEKRRRQHLKAARNNYDRFAFHSAIRKYGSGCIAWTVLEYNINTQDELNEAEKYWIREKKSLIPNGYNMTIGGKGSANHRKKFTPWNKGKKNCFSPEALNKIRTANKGKPPSENLIKSISKPVLMYDRSENFVMEFSSITSAAMYLGAKHQHVSAVLRGKCKSVRGYTFRYKNEKTRKRISSANAKPVLMFNRNGDFVAEFPSITAAAEYLSVKDSQVSAVLTGKHKTAGGGSGNKNAGYMFKYKNENPDR